LYCTQERNNDVFSLFHLLSCCLLSLRFKEVKDNKMFHRMLKLLCYSSLFKLFYFVNYLKWLSFVLIVFWEIKNPCVFNPRNQNIIFLPAASKKHFSSKTEYRFKIADSYNLIIVIRFFDKVARRSE
jgi:hypothetical protein